MEPRVRPRGRPPLLDPAADDVRSNHRQEHIQQHQIRQRHPDYHGQVDLRQQSVFFDILKRLWLLLIGFFKVVVRVLELLLSGTSVNLVSYAGICLGFMYATNKISNSIQSIGVSIPSTPQNGTSVPQNGTSVLTEFDERILSYATMDYVDSMYVKKDWLTQNCACSDYYYNKEQVNSLVVTQVSNELKRFATELKMYATLDQLSQYHMKNETITIQANDTYVSRQQFAVDIANLTTHINDTYVSKKQFDEELVKIVEEVDDQ